MHKQRMLFTVLLLAAAGGSAQAADKVRVVASLPNLASIAQEVGGDRVEVSSIATGSQDAHFVDPKPSFMLKLRSADLFLVNGLDLEIGWVPPLALGARNPRILPGAVDYVDCSTDVHVVEIPSGSVSRAEGDVHPYGNPHYLTDPLNAEPVAAQIAAALTRKSPADAALFATRRDDFTKRLHVAVFGTELVDLVGGTKLARLTQSDELAAFLASSVVDGRPLIDRLGGWLGRMRSVARVKVISYHKDWSYFAPRFGLEVVDYIEPKPGIQPSAKHLAELTDRLVRGDVRMILTRPYVEHRSSDVLAGNAKIPVLTLPMEVGGDPQAADYFKLFDFVTTQITEAAKGR